MIKIVEIPSNKKKLKEFVDFTYRLYENSPYFVPNFRDSDLNVLLKSKNPAFDYCEAKYFMAFKDGKAAGKIAAIINHKYIEKWGKKNGRFGFVDFIDDFEFTKKLFLAAEGWLKSKGMTGIQGPLGFTDLDPEGMLTRGFDEIGTLTTIYNYSYYPKYLEKLNYKKEVEWYEYKMKPPSKNIREIEKISNYSKKKLGLKVVDIKNKKHLLALAPRIFELINISYSHLYSTVELSEKQIDYYTKEYFSVLNPKYIRLIENNNEEIIAFGVGLPSVAKAMQESGGKLFPFGFIKLLKAFKSPKRVELILIAVHPDYQKKGVNAIILDELIKSCNQYNIEEFDLNPQLATNTDVISQWDYFDIVQNKNRVSYYKDLK